MITQHGSLVLVSKSPRRQDLLRSMGVNFEVRNLQFEESYLATSPENIVKEICYKKAQSIPEEWLDDRTWFVTADTIVWLQGELLGKPINREDAIEMLKKMQGKIHEVYSAICLRKESFFDIQCDKAEVEILPMTEEEILFYIDRYQPFDKAGSYGVQDWLGINKISRIKGSFYTVMGLPTHLLYQMFLRYGILYINNV